MLHVQAVADKYLLKVLLIGAKEAITRKWIQLTASSREDLHPVLRYQIDYLQVMEV